jgi:hypothetical protein
MISIGVSHQSTPSCNPPYSFTLLSAEVIITIIIITLLSAEVSSSTSPRSLPARDLDSSA